MKIQGPFGVVSFCDCNWVPVAFSCSQYAGVIAFKCYRDHIDLWPQFSMRTDNQSDEMMESAYALAQWLLEGMNQ